MSARGDGVGTFRPLVIDEEARAVWKGDTRIPLTRSEYALLFTLAGRPRHALSSRVLLEAMWGGEWLTDTSPLQIHVSRLRGKLGESAANPQHIITVHGFGYRFEPDPQQHTSTDLTPDRLEAEYDGSRADDTLYGVFAPDRTCRWASRSLEAMLGLSPQGLVGLTLAKWIHADDHDLVGQLRQDVDAGTAAGARIRLRGADGGYHPVDALITPVLSPDETLSAIFAEFTPVTALGSSHPGPMRAPLDTRRVHRCVELEFDASLELRGVSPHAPFLGYAPDDVIGTAFSPTGIATPVLLGVVAALIAAGTDRIDGMVDMFTAEGEAIRIRVEQELLVDADGRFAGMHSTLHLAD